MLSKLKIFAPLIALSLILAGCSSEENVVTDNTNTTQNQNNQPVEETAQAATESVDAEKDSSMGHSNGHHHLTGDGLKSSVSGYEIKLLTAKIPSKEAVNLEFTLTKDGEVLREIPIAHEHPVHLVIVAKDLSWYRHVHPYQDSKDPNAKWVVPTNMPYDGDYRVIAQFNQPMDDHEMTYAIGADLKVGTGKLSSDKPMIPPFEKTQTSQPSNYKVTLDAEGPLNSQEHTKATFSVKDENGKPVSLGQYLGAGAHIIGFRASDGAYIHLHGELDSTGNKILVDLEFGPGSGQYRLFVEFQASGKVDLVGFTVDVA